MSTRSIDRSAVIHDKNRSAFLHDKDRSAVTPQNDRASLCSFTFAIAAIVALRAAIAIPTSASSTPAGKHN